MNSYENIYKAICRVCLSHSKYDNMVSLFDKSEENGLSCYGKSVITFANVLLKSKDMYPTMMCKNCMLLLKQAIRFKQKCENSDNRLKKLMKIKQSSEQNFQEILCQYMFYNFYFAENSLQSPSLSMDKARPPVQTRIPDLKPPENLFNLENTSDSQKPNEIFNRYDFLVSLENHNDDLENNCDDSDKGFEDRFLDKLEKMFNSNIDVTGSTYINKFMSKKQKKFNLKTNTNKPTSYICSICKKNIKNRLTYNRHMQRHNGYRYMCESCGKCFPTLTELNSHQIACHGIGPYLQCHHCPYKAPRKLNLIEHLRLHTGERPYTCDKCGLTFRRRAIWRKHLIYHTEKNYQCSQCEKKFFRHCALLSHINNIHDRLYVFMCNKCGATYAKTMTVRRHLSEKHGIPRELQGKILRVMRISSSVAPLK